MQKARRWNTSFLYARNGQVDLSLAREVLEGLGRMPLLGAGLPLGLLAKFMQHESLRRLATDSEWVALVRRAMAEMSDMIPDVCPYRFEMVFSCIPDDVCLPAFQGLGGPQRLKVIRRSVYAADDLMPYVKAAVDAVDIPLSQRVALLDDLLEAVEMAPHQRELLGWREALPTGPGG